MKFSYRVLIIIAVVVTLVIVHYSWHRLSLVEQQTLERVKLFESHILAARGEPQETLIHNQWNASVFRQWVR